MEDEDGPILSRWTPKPRSQDSAEADRGSGQRDSASVTVPPQLRPSTAAYLSVISRAVADLPANTNEGRRAVFARARQAMIRQLLDWQPPLTKSRIESEFQSFKEAVSIVEADEVRRAQNPEAFDTAAVREERPPSPSEPSSNEPAAIAMLSAEAGDLVSAPIFEPEPEKVRNSAHDTPYQQSPLAKSVEATFAQEGSPDPARPSSNQNTAVATPDLAADDRVPAPILEPSREQISNAADDTPRRQAALPSSNENAAVGTPDLSGPVIPAAAANAAVETPDLPAEDVVRASILEPEREQLSNSAHDTPGQQALLANSLESVETVSACEERSPDPGWPSSNEDAAIRMPGPEPGGLAPALSLEPKHNEVSNSAPDTQTVVSVKDQGREYLIENLPGQAGGAKEVPLHPRLQAMVQAARYQNVELDPNEFRNASGEPIPSAAALSQWAQNGGMWSRAVRIRWRQLLRFQ